MDDFPNVLIVPANESPDEIIEDYVAIISYNLERGEPLEEILYAFFDEVNRWSCKQFLIDAAKQSLFELENISKIEEALHEENED
jgi:signal recognition particle receptor subunit beta